MASSYIVYSGGASTRPKSFGYLKTARKYAKTEADATGVSSIIYASSGRGTWHVRPSKKRNPLPSGGRFVPARVKRLRNGKYQIVITNPRKRRSRRRR